MKGYSDSVIPVEEDIRPIPPAWRRFLLAGLALAACAFYGGTHMVGGGDTWMALAVGRQIAEHGTGTFEPFSFNSRPSGPSEAELKKWPGWARRLAAGADISAVRYWHPTGWINQNWMSHLFFYRLAGSPGRLGPSAFNALVYWKFLLCFLIALVVFACGRLSGARFPAALAAACGAMFVIRPFMDIRPAGFSNLFAGLLFLILAFSVKRRPAAVWLAVPLACLWANLHGGFVFLLIAIPLFAGVQKAVAALRRRGSPFGARGFLHPAGAWLASLAGIVFFNPYHVANLTHPLVVGIGPQAKIWRSIREWRPIFAGQNGFGSTTPFLIMILLLALIPLTGAVLRRRGKPPRTGFEDGNAPRRTDETDPAPGLVAIVVQAAGMAFAARRFIPLAAIVGCPVLAVLADRFVRKRDRQSGRLGILARRWGFAAALGSVLILSAAWGVKFKRVYLDPWPIGPGSASLFMRMTGSEDKPLGALAFIRLNGMSGRMFNDWADGGFLAWGQDPDRRDGRIPLQVYIAGTAQAAFEAAVYETWRRLLGEGLVAPGGNDGPIAASAPDWKARGLEVDAHLKKQGVWVVLLPHDLAESGLMKALATVPDWRAALINHTERIFVDITTAGGKETYAGIFSGKTVFPDEFSRLLTIGSNLIPSSPDAPPDTPGLSLVVQAFRLEPSPIPLMILAGAAAVSPALRPGLDALCREYADGFPRLKNSWAEAPGFYRPLAAARWACFYLAQRARETGNPDRSVFYGKEAANWSREERRLVRRQRW